MYIYIFWPFIAVVWFDLVWLDFYVKIIFPFLTFPLLYLTLPLPYRVLHGRDINIGD